MALIPYAYAFWRVSIIGTVAAGSDEFVMSFHMGNTAADAPVPTNGDASLVASRAFTWFTNGYMGISHVCQATTLRISRILATGATDLNSTVETSFASNCVGGAGTSRRPQDALPISLISANVSRGPGRWGRMLLPNFSIDGQDNGHLPSSVTTNIASTTKTFLDGVNSDLAAKNIRVCNPSHGHRTWTNKPTKPAVYSYGTPSTAIVTDVKVGDVVGSVDRRRNKLRPVYQGVTLAP